MTNFDESDQAGLIMSLQQAHLNAHGGKVNPDCSFCQHFIIAPTETHDKEGKPLTSYSFVILDMSDESNKNKL